MIAEDRADGEAFRIPWPWGPLFWAPGSINGECRNVTKEREMGEKSHVAMEHRICVICGKDYETGAILLDTKLRKRLESEQVTGWGCCPDCDGKLEGGERIALVECESRKDWQRNEMKPDEARRTGRICFIRRAAFRAIFNASDEKDGKPLRMVWVEDGVIAKLEAMAAQSGEDAGDDDEGSSTPEGSCHGPLDPPDDGALDSRNEQRDY